MLTPQFVDEVQRVEAGVVGDGAGDDFQSLGEHVHDELFFSRDFDCIFFESLGQFHFSGSASSHYLVGLETSANDHDGVVERTFCLFDELFGSSSQDNRG